jgi:hypothetical protein
LLILRILSTKDFPHPHLAGFCHIREAKNPQILPEKWAKTSIVIKLQQLHNSLVALPQLRD